MEEATITKLDNLLERIGALRNSISNISLQSDVDNKALDALHNANSYLQNAELEIEDLIMAEEYKH